MERACLYSFATYAVITIYLPTHLALAVIKIQKFRPLEAV